jgi:hypothetical protein
VVWLRSILRNIPLLLQHISDSLGLVEEVPANLVSIFAKARWAELVVLEMKVVSGPYHTSGNFHIFALGLLHPKQPSTSKILVEKPCQVVVWIQCGLHIFLSVFPSSALALRLWIGILAMGSILLA